MSGPSLANCKAQGIPKGNFYDRQEYKHEAIAILPLYNYTILDDTDAIETHAGQQTNDSYTQATSKQKITKVYSPVVGP
jgi:hypothetical protein